MQTAAQYYDGQTAASQAVTLRLVDRYLQFQANGESQNLVLQDVRVVPPVGEGVWVIEMRHGGSLQFRDKDFGRHVTNSAGQGSLLRHLENSWPWAVAALGVVIVGTWALLTFGVPSAARYVAFSIPTEATNKISAEGLGLLDDVLFDPSELSSETQNHVRQLFDDITGKQQDSINYQLEFRSSKAIGANAFAVPGGLVVITDQMIEISISDDEISAVLAHEVGHQANRHSLRILLQDSASALIIAGLTGDLASVTALSATVPTVLMQAKYSRDFEREADEFAFTYLDSRGIDSNVLSELLSRIEARSDGSRGNVVPGWLSSHPRPEERIRDQ